MNRSVSMFDHVLIPILSNSNQQSQCIPSTLLIGWYTLSHPSPLYSEQVLKAILHQFLLVSIPWLLAPEGINRTVSQVVVSDLLEKHPGFTQDDTIRRIFGMLEENKRIMTMRKKQHILLSQINPQLQASVVSLLRSNQNNLNDFVPEMKLEEMRLMMEDILSDWYHEDYPNQPPQYPDRTIDETELISQDFQKKILPWSEVGKEEVEKRRKQSVIVVATYVDKLYGIVELLRIGLTWADWLVQVRYLL